MMLLAELVPALLAYVGFTLLSLVMDRHRRQLWPSANGWPPRTTHAIRVLGWSLLLLSLWRSIHLWGVGIGLVAWFGALTFAVFVLILQMTYFPRRVTWSAAAALVICVPSVLIL